ncbi:MAG TPA: hypothetical protein VG274_08295 [Rhizomicrobium sp.]|jgi:hypothetical protein|nr:hypothetical protein [Rhizomicrobium sp.]
MKITDYLVAGVSALAVSVSLSATASAHQIYYPYKHGVTARLDPNRPLGHVGRYEPPYVARRHPSSGTWTDVSGKLPFMNGPWALQQLTDGTVLVQDFCTSQWYKLTPDKKGQYYRRHLECDRGDAGELRAALLRHPDPAERADDRERGRIYRHR